MRGPEGIWNFPGTPRDTVDYQFSDTDKYTLSEMGAVLITRGIYDDYIHVTVRIETGNVLFGYGTTTSGASLSPGDSIEFYGLEQVTSVWFSSSDNADIRIFVEY